MNKPHKNALEWAVFAASVIVIVAVAGQLAVSAFRQKTSPPDLHVATERPVPTHGGWRVAVLVRNTGDQTAEQVKVEVALRRGGEEVERAELDIVFVPRKSSRRGWVTFRSDPGGCTVAARAMSYETP